MPDLSSVKVAVVAQDKTGEGIKSAQKGIGGLTKIAKAYFAEIAAAYAAMRGLISVIKDTTQAYIEQENAVSQMDTALRATGIYTPTLSKELQNLASQLQGTSIYGDETIASMTGLLQSMGNLSGEGLKQAIPMVLDMATSLKMDLNTAASLVAKTLGSSTNALARYGFEMKKGMSDTQKLGALQDWITERFKGSAAAAAETFGGKITQIKNVIGDVKEVIGKMLLEQGAPFINWLLDFLKNGENIQVIAKIVQGFGAVFTTVFTVVVAGLKTTIAQFKLLGNIVKTEIELITLLFSPKKWGTGEMKRVLTDFRNAVTDIATDTYETWIKTGQTVGKAWGKMFKDVDLTITTASSSVDYLGGNVNDLASDMEDAIATGENYAGIMSEVAGMAYRAEPQYRELAKSIDEVTLSMANMAGGYVVLDEKAAKTGLTFKDVADTFQEYVKPAFSDAWESIWSGTKSFLELMKDAVKTFISEFLKMLARQYLALALTLWMRPLQMVKNLAVSAALFAAAAAVHSMQQGGIVKKQQGGMQFGDRVPAMLEPGEAVIPRRTVQRNAAAIGFMQTGGQYSFTVPLYLDGRVIAKNTVGHINKGRAPVSDKQVVKIS